MQQQAKQKRNAPTAKHSNAHGCMHTGAKQDCCERTAPHPSLERGWSDAAAGGGADVGHLSLRIDSGLADDSITVVARSFGGDQREVALRVAMRTATCVRPLSRPPNAEGLPRRAVALTVGSSLRMSAGLTTPPPACSPPSPSPVPSCLPPAAARAHHPPLLRAQLDTPSSSHDRPR